MKSKIILVLAGFACLFLIIPGPGQDQGIFQQPLEREELENYLNKAEIIRVETFIGAGRQQAWEITLKDGKITRRALFKYVDRQRPHIAVGSYKYELAAYQLDKLLDLGRIPPVIKREIRGRKGSLQIFVEGCITETMRRKEQKEPPDKKAFEESLEEINVFENLTYCPRNDLGDILVHLTDWRVCRVDFSEAFAPHPKFLPDTSVNRCSRKFFQNLKKLKDEVLKDKIDPYLNKEEMDALLERKRLIVEAIEKMIKEKGEEAVLFN